MCGVIGIVSDTAVNQQLYDGLTILQHRGQDAAGIITADGSFLSASRGRGLVRDVFTEQNMATLIGHAGIAHVRYPTAGRTASDLETQPFYVNSPFGIALAHNGNLTNTEALAQELFDLDRRHINTRSDSEVLLNVFAHELHRTVDGGQLSPEVLFKSLEGVYRRCQGGFAVVVLIAGYGLLAFRDRYGIRPLTIGQSTGSTGQTRWCIASESVALDVLDFDQVRDVAPGEAVFISFDGKFHSQSCVAQSELAPCIFEYVYLARPDSTMNGVSVYQSRLKLGQALAQKVKQEFDLKQFDVVMPVPDSSRPAAMELARVLNLPYREGLVKNRYIGRTFIMAGQEQRRKSVRQKLNVVGEEFVGKSVLLVDDSIVRGTTSKEIIDLARGAGAKAVHFASTAPPVRYPNVYGIDMPFAHELVASNRDDHEIAAILGADRVIYQNLYDMEDAVRACGGDMTRFDASCFTGEYLTGDIDSSFLTRLAKNRHSDKTNDDVNYAIRQKLMVI